MLGGAIGPPSLIPRPISSLQCFTLKSRRAWYAKSCATCCDDRSWRGMMQTKSRSSWSHQNQVILCCPCLLSTIAYCLSRWRIIFHSLYNDMSMSLVVCQLTSPVIFDPWGDLDLLSPPLSITWFCIQGPHTFHRETSQHWIASWKWAWERG